MTARYVELMVRTWPEPVLRVPRPQRLRPRDGELPRRRSRAGARGVHTSVNGMGERAGNTRLAEVVAAMHDHTPSAHARARGRASPPCRGWSRPSAARTSPRTRRSSAATSSPRPRASTPTATRRAISTPRGWLPARFGSKRRYALGKLSGKASVDQNLDALGIELTAAERDLVLEAHHRARRQEAHRRASRTCPTSSPTC